MVVEVGDDDVALVVEADAARRVKVFPERALEAVLVEEGAVGGEELDAVVARVRHQDLTVRVDGQVPRVVELPALGAFLAEFEEEGAVECEDLDAVVVLVGHDDATQVIGSHSGRSIELSGTLSGRSEPVVEDAHRVEDLDAVVAPVGDDDVAVFIAGHAPGPAQLAFQLALFAQRQHGRPDRVVVATAAHQDAERGAVDVPPADEHRDHVAPFHLRPVRERVGAVLTVLHVGPVRDAVGSVDDGHDGVSAHQTSIALMILDVHCETGHVVAQGAFDAVTEGHRRGSESRAGDETQRADGLQQSPVGRIELDDVVLLRLEAAANLTQLLEL